MPILLSIGYSACHWCHVMEHESFADEAVAELMNRLFVSIKVDREERPDVDAIYMDAVVVADRQRRLADDGLPDARRPAVLGRHVLPARAARTACRRSAQRAGGASTRRTAPDATRSTGRPTS